jgi:hypothetical protein
MSQLKQLRNSASINDKVRGTALRAISRPSDYLLKNYELRNELSELDGFVKIKVADETVRVIPRATRDNGPLWVCVEDLATCIQFIKRLGISTSHDDDDLPKGIRGASESQGSDLLLISSRMTPRRSILSSPSRKPSICSSDIALCRAGTASVVVNIELQQAALIEPVWLYMFN